MAIKRRVAKELHKAADSLRSVAVHPPFTTVAPVYVEGFTDGMHLSAELLDLIASGDYSTHALMAAVGRVEAARR